MHIGWVTPMVARSAIGRVSVGVTESLAQAGYAVTLIGCESEPPREPLHPTSLPSHHLSERPLASYANDYDILVVNIGDNYLFHGGVFALFDQAPVLGVFHDFYLHNLFNGWLQARGASPAEAVSVLISVYGSGSMAAAERARAGEMELEELAATFPMTEWVASRCAGALAHSTFYVPRLCAACPGPIAMARLPVASRGVTPLAVREGPRLRVLTVGVMNANKCADSVIEALCASPALIQCADYRLAGPISDEERSRLQSLAAARGFHGLQILGEMDEAQLNAELSAADAICCLRRPILEGASASAIEALLSGRPTIVADAGFYGEIPDAAALKIPSEIPVDSLRGALERLASDEPFRRRLGASGREWAQAHFGVAGYTNVLRELLPSVVRAGPWLQMAGRLGAELAELGLGGDPAYSARLGALLNPLARGPETADALPSRKARQRRRRAAGN